MTFDQAKAYLLSMGIEPPDAIISAWLAVFLEVDVCLDANYNPEVKLLILSSLIALFGLAAGTRYIASQSAPSGASRSFRYGDIQNLWKGQLNMIRLLDKYNCVGALIPEAPSKSGAFLGVGKGGAYC